jgi:hypothetical protein
MNKRDFKSIIIPSGLAFVLFPSILFIFASISANAQGAKIFENAVLGAKISYPANWNVEYKGLTVTFKSPDENSAIKLFSILGIDGGLDLEDVANGLINYKEGSAENFQIINKGPTSINGKDFYSFLLRISDDGVVVRDLNLVTGVEDTPYIFNLQSRDNPSNQELSDQLYSEGLSILQQMIMSAELTGLDLDSLKEGLDGGRGDDFNPFEQGPDDQGDGFGGQSPGGSGGNNDGGDSTPPQQSPPSEPLCGPGSCIIS